MVTNELRLEQGEQGCYALWHGFSLRAIIMPTNPTRWNGKARWRVDAIGLNAGNLPAVRTLAQAKAIAYHYASY
jgi:hypothetical protein